MGLPTNQWVKMSQKQNGYRNAGDVRLNDLISESDAPVATEAQLLLNTTLETITKPLATDLKPTLTAGNITTGNITTETIEFFENFYTKPDYTHHE